jgi:cell pole-organizing protein PopZ
MTQPAKVQEPSMEEILASIRRIIADDEAKPPAAAEKPAAAPAPPPAAARPVEKPAAPAPKPAMADVPPSKMPAAVAAAAKAAAPSPPPPPPPPAPTPAPAPAAPAAAKNNQDDIDALLAGLDETTTAEEVRPPQPDGDVFELTDEMVAPAPPPPAPAAPRPPAPKAAEPAFQKVEPEDDLEFAESAASRVIHQPPTYAPSSGSTAIPPPTGPHQAILSQSTVSAVESAFNTLANTVLSNNARTLEDLVKEMLRPMLKSWLDDNLPGLVERIVKAEIERVSRGR